MVPFPILYLLVFPEFENISYVLIEYPFESCHVCMIVESHLTFDFYIFDFTIPYTEVTPTYPFIITFGHIY